MAQRYDTYKDSGVQWLGMIPGHWGCVKLDRIFVHSTGKTLNGITSEGVEMEYLTTSNVYSDHFDLSSIKTMKFNSAEIEKYTIRKGDLLVLEGGDCGRANIWDKDYNICFQNHLHRLRPQIETCVRFHYYWLNHIKSVGAFENIARGVAIKGLSATALGNIKIPLPPLSEQRSIVSYLDDKCGKIDEWVDKKQKEVEHLKELKQRVIADAVTRGLNPDVKMKATNIAWLPEVPKHWEVLRAKHMFNKEQRPIENGDEIVTCFRDGEVTLRKNRRTTGFTEATDYSHYQHICKGDLVIHQMDAFAGSAGVSDSDGMGTPVLSVCTPKSENILNEYYAHIVRLMGKSGFILSLYRGIRERSSDFRFDTFAKLWLPLPPLSEQRAIVSYITERTAKIDKLVENVNKEIEALKEYKQRLISDVVTGQIKVC